jgi:hypothetical protein
MAVLRNAEQDSYIHECILLRFHAAFWILLRKCGPGSGPALSSHDGARPRAADLLANSPDWLKAEPMRENLLASCRQSGQKQDHDPALPNHNATSRLRLSPYRDFANRSAARGRAPSWEENMGHHLGQGQQWSTSVAGDCSEVERFWVT